MLITWFQIPNLAGNDDVYTTYMSLKYNVIVSKELVTPERSATSREQAPASSSSPLKEKQWAPPVPPR